MDDVDRVVREQRLERVVDRRDRLGGGALRGGADDAGDLDPEQAEGMDVNDTDEAGADDSRAKPAVPHARIISQGRAAVRRFPVQERPVKACSRPSGPRSSRP